MKVLYVPRSDADVVTGGDVLYAGSLCQALGPLGVELVCVEVDHLEHVVDADAVFLTQIYQIDVAEKVAHWVSRRGIPLLISPLYEEGDHLGFRLTVQGEGKWSRISRIIGSQAAEELYVRREAARRTRQGIWQRQRQLLQQAYVVSNTHYELEHLRRWFKLTNLRATIIPLGIDPGKFNLESGGATEFLPAQIQAWRGKYLLQVGLISARKNQLSLLRAMDDSLIPVVLIGRHSPYEPGYVSEVTQLARARGTVAMLEHVDLSTLAALYGQAAAHVLPSWSERPGLVSLEAAACGCNVVTSTAAPIWEYLGQEVDICAPNSSKSIQQAVLNAMNRKSTLSLSNKITSTYTWDRTAGAFRQMLRDIIA